MTIKIVGLFSLTGFIWSIVTGLTFGLPQQLCFWIDTATFHLLTNEVMRMGNGFYYDVNNNDMPTAAFMLLFFIQFILYLHLIQCVKDKKIQASSLWLVIIFSIFYRLILVPGVLIHENDIYRYLWDGKASINGVNPYKFAPSDLFMYEHKLSADFHDSLTGETVKAKQFSRNDLSQLAKLKHLKDANKAYYRRIGHWQVPTIYPPVAQAVFALSAFLKIDSIIVMKILFVFFDIGVLWAVTGILEHLKINPAYCLIYGFSPLVLIQISNSGHYDSLSIFLTMLSLLLTLKNKKAASVSILALATLTKFFSGVLLPFYGKSIKIRNYALFSLILILFYIPFFFWDQVSLKGVFAGLLIYNEKWAYNASIFTIVNALYQFIFSGLKGNYLPAKLTMGVFYLGFIFYLQRNRSKNDLGLVKAYFLAIAVLFIINPVGDPWYYCWSIPFLCVFPKKSWLMLSGLLVLSYFNFHSDYRWLNIAYFDIPLMNWIIYLPFYGMLIYESLKKDINCL